METIAGVHSRRWLFQGNTPHPAAVQNSGRRKARAIKETHLPYKDFLLDTE